MISPGSSASAGSGSRLPAHIFLNYARKDREIADWLRDRLIRAGAEVWMDRSEIEGGDQWWQEIYQALWQRQFLVAVLTRNSVSPEREWVHREQERAETLLKTIIPCLFEDRESFEKDGLMPERLQKLEGDLQTISFSPDREAGFFDLVNAIRGKLLRHGDKLADQTETIEHAFVGRDGDLRRLKRSIDVDSQTETGRRAIAIVGMGGIGKTMLAKELSRRLAFHYPGGVLVESRGSTPEPAEVVMRRWVTTALGKPPDRSYKEEEVRALLSKNFGELLVLIDNVQEEDLADTKRLLSALPPSTTRIVTTRRPDLCVPLSAICYELQPLSTEDGLDLLASRMRDRFGEAFDGAPATFEDELAKYREDLLTLVERLNGHPLALSLGIGACQNMGKIPEFVKRLTNSLESGVRRFREPGAKPIKPGGVLEAADRNSSLAASLEFSLADLATSDEQQDTDWVRRFAALGVLPDGAKIPKDLLLALWGDTEKTEDDAEDAINGLLGRTMLSSDYRNSDIYFNHPVIRAYATELLQEDPTAAELCWDRYREWVIRRAEEAYRQPQEEWTKYALLADHVRQVGRSIVDSLEETLESLPHLTEPEPLSEEKLSALREADPELADCGLRFALAVKEVVIRRPEWGEAGLRVLRLGVLCARATGSQTSEVEFLKRLGEAFTRAKPKLARQYFEGSLHLARRIEESEQVASILTLFGELERIGGNWDRALTLLEDALNLHRKHGDNDQEADTLRSIGEVYWRKSDFNAALNRYALAKSIYQRNGNVSGEADILNKVASVEFNRGEQRTAIEIFRQALELHEKVGNLSMQAEDLQDMGACYRYLGDAAIALDLFQEAKQIDLELGNRRHEAFVRSNTAATFSDLERFQEAYEEAMEAIEVAEEVGDPIPLFFAHCWKARALTGLGRKDEAEEVYRKALEMGRSNDSPRGLAGVLSMYGVFLLEQRARREDALTLLAEALEVMETKKLDQAFGGMRIDEIREKLG